MRRATRPHAPGASPSIRINEDVSVKPNGFRARGGALALPAFALASVLLSTGCGGGDAQPSSGATLVVARVKDAVGLDPAHETDGLSLNITSEVFQNLVRFKPGGFDIGPEI